MSKKYMDIKLEVYESLPCATKEFAINGIKSDIDWFVDNYDNGDGEKIEYGCNNRVTDKLSVEEVRNNLPEELRDLTDKEIILVQDRLSNELVSGGCGWCV